MSAWGLPKGFEKVGARRETVKLVSTDRSLWRRYVLSANEMTGDSDARIGECALERLDATERLPDWRHVERLSGRFAEMSEALIHEVETLGAQGWKIEGGCLAARPRWSWTSRPAGKISGSTWKEQQFGQIQSREEILKKFKSNKWSLETMGPGRKVSGRKVSIRIDADGDPTVAGQDGRAIAIDAPTQGVLLYLGALNRDIALKGWIEADGMTLTDALYAEGSFLVERPGRIRRRILESLDMGLQRYVRVATIGIGETAKRALWEKAVRTPGTGETAKRALWEKAVRTPGTGVTLRGLATESRAAIEIPATAIVTAFASGMRVDENGARTARIALSAEAIVYPIGMATLAEGVDDIEPGGWGIGRLEAITMDATGRNVEARLATFASADDRHGFRFEQIDRPTVEALARLNPFETESARSLERAGWWSMLPQRSA